MNPERLPNLSISSSNGGIDNSGLEICRRISSTYNERCWGLPSIAIGAILGWCLILAANGSIEISNKKGDKGHP